MEKVRLIQKILYPDGDKRSFMVPSDPFYWVRVNSGFTAVEWLGEGEPQQELIWLAEAYNWYFDKEVRKFFPR
jgi:hypothetical protein